jgi:hypothetical protein
LQPENKDVYMTDMLNMAKHCILALAVIGCLTGCIGGDDSEEYPLDDAELIAFSLSSDSVPQLDSIHFTIDQVNGLIYNHDSLRFGTEIKWAVKVNYSNAYSTTSLQVAREDTTIWIASGDTLDVMKPFTFINFSYNGSKSKYYTFKLNIHQIDPDSTQYFRIASGENLAFLRNDDFRAVVFGDRYWIFTRDGETVRTMVSDDVVSWQAAAAGTLPTDVRLRDIKVCNGQLYTSTASGKLLTTADPSGVWTEVDVPHTVRALTGYLFSGSEPPASQQTGLGLLFDIYGQTFFGFHPESGGWIVGEAVPDGFPTSEFESFSSEYVKKGRITVIDGRDANNEPLNTVWSTQNGLYWAKLSGNRADFPVTYSPNTFYYAGEYRLMNGMIKDTGYNRDMLYSTDGGVTWATKVEKTALPDDYIGRWSAQVVVSPDGTTFYVIGGKTYTEAPETDYLPEIWKCYLNSMLFPKDE